MAEILSARVEMQTTHFSKARQMVARIGLALTFAAGPVSLAQAAHAEAAKTVEGTYGTGLSVRESPSTQSAKLAMIPEGGSFLAECWTPGENVDGNEKWEKGRYGDATGYVSDRYLSTGYYPSSAELAAQHIPQCEETQPPKPQPPLSIGNYNRDAVAQWGREHAQDTPPYAASCTQFVSLAMWQSGVRMSHAWNNGSFHAAQYQTGGRPGTPTAWNAEALQNYLATAFDKSYARELNFSKNEVPDAEVGDVIGYDWDGDETTDHLALVVSKDGDYPEVAEWSALGGTKPSTYVARGWTWSKINNNWLQAKYGSNIKATLVHVDPRSTPVPDDGHLS